MDIWIVSLIIIMTFFLLVTEMTAIDASNIIVNDLSGMYGYAQPGMFAL